jgi:hypothetical protein
MNKSNFIKKRQELRGKNILEANERKQRLTKFLAIYGAVVATALSTYSAYKEFKPKQHDLEILISDLEVNNDSAEYGIAFYNNGDYTEIITNASSLLGQTIEGFKLPLNWEQENCFRPISIKAGESNYIRYITKFEFSDLKHSMPSALKPEYLMSIDLDILSELQGVITERIPVGTLRPYQNKESLKGKANFEFHTQKISVNFNNGHPKNIQGIYPQDAEFSFRTLCNKKT